MGKEVRKGMGIGGKELFLARKQSSHELILAAKASNGGGHSSCSAVTTPDRGSGRPRLRGSARQVLGTLWGLGTLGHWGVKGVPDPLSYAGSGPKCASRHDFARDGSNDDG